MVCLFHRTRMEKAVGKTSPSFASLDRMFSPSTTGTYANFKGNAAFKTNNKPSKGALVVWRYGNGMAGAYWYCNRCN